VFAPIHDAGLIVVDEEHDAAYKQEEGLRYNARDLAVALGRFSQCPVVLGSATPAAESYANTRRGPTNFCAYPIALAKRELAKVETIDLRPAFGNSDNGNRTARTDENVAQDPVLLAPSLIDALKRTSPRMDRA